MGERGLYKFSGLLLLGMLVVGALAWIIGGDESAEAAPAALRDEPRAAGAPAARAESVDRPAPAAGACEPDGALRPLAAEIHESSGVAVSRAHPGIFWTHNDSGDPLLYAVDSLGRTVGRVRVAGAAMEDWEDVSRAPCPGGGDCLYVADIGDNDAARPSVTVYRLPEPEPGAGQSAPAAAIRLRYPDGAQDAEAMFVLGGAIHIVTKGETGPIAIYRAPVDAAAGTTLERIRELAPGKVERPERITSADASADGRWIVMRTLGEAILYPAAELAGSGAAPSPLRVDLKGLEEAQGEGIGFAPDGSLLVTSEGGKKKDPATFARLACTLP